MESGIIPMPEIAARHGGRPGQILGPSGKLPRPTMMPHALLLTTLRIWTFALIGLLLIGCGTPTLIRHENARPLMGTQFRVVLYAPDARTADRALDAAFARIDQLNTIMSDWDPQSELSRLSRAAQQGPTDAIPVSDDLLRVLIAAKKWSAASDGAFDITVGPAVRLWRSAQRQKALPAKHHLAEALEAMGDAKLLVDAGSRSVRLGAAGMRLDLGGIAKGYAADAALLILQQHGIRSALVDAGGDLTLGDAPPGEDGWRIDIRPFGRAEPGDPVRTLIAANCAVATSGDAFRHVEIDGTRYSHIVDPTTAIGLTRSIAVTAIAPSGTDADAMASALSVLGPEKGLKLVDQIPGASALITLQNPQGRIQTFESSGISQLQWRIVPGGQVVPPSPSRVSH